jgi:hypothetical protein
VQEDECSMNVFKEHHPICSVCGSLCNYKFTPTIIQFALKDGPSGCAPSKGNRFKKYRETQSQKMEKRQKDRYGHLKRDVIPNSLGKITEDWREAQSLTMQNKEYQEMTGKDPLSIAKTFEPKIQAEKLKKI